MNKRVLKNIRKDLRVKNYKEMCKLLKEKENTGKSKKLQLERWSLYFEWHKEGNAFVIDEVFDTPKIKIDKRSEGNNSTYAEGVKKLIIHLCSASNNLSNSTVSIALPISVALERLGFVNEDYNNGYKNVEAVANIIAVEKQVAFDFFNSSRSNFIGVVKTGLENLQKDKLIFYRNAYEITVNEEKRIATNEEIQKILDAEQKVLKEMGYDKKFSLISTGKMDIFYKRVINLLDVEGDSLEGISFYRFIYEIIPSHNFINMCLEEKEINNIRNNINIKAYNSCINSANNRHKKIKDEIAFGEPAKEREKVRFKEEYIEDSKKLANRYIKFFD